MKYSISILLLLIYCGCSRGKYYVTSTFRNGEPPGFQYIYLDTSYRFYKREVFIDKDQNSQNILRSNLAKADTADKIRIEVEYLLVSFLHRNVIYITTVPDKFQQYYSNNYLPDTIINAYDFSTFHFGKLDNEGENVIFTANGGVKKKTKWQLKPLLANGYPQQLFLKEIYIMKKDMLADVFVLDMALQEPVVFTLQPGFTIVFKRPGDNVHYEPLTKHRLEGNKIYIHNNKHGVNLYLRFSSAINAKDSAISFYYKRTIYDPGPLAAGAGTNGNR